MTPCLPVLLVIEDSTPDPINVVRYFRLEDPYDVWQLGCAKAELALHTLAGSLSLEVFK